MVTVRTMVTTMRLTGTWQRMMKTAMAMATAMPMATATATATAMAMAMATATATAMVTMSALECSIYAVGGS